MISHKFKCIFVHIPKVAGQSIERVFVDLHGLTWDTRAPLLLRSNQNLKMGPPRLAHLKASEYVSCQYISQELYDSYFTFSFVRNPWSRLVSVYKYLGFAGKMTLKQFLVEGSVSAMDWETRLFMEQQYTFLYDEDSNQLVDYIGRFENLNHDFDVVCSKVGIQKARLPHVNRTGGKGGLRSKVMNLARQVSPLHRNLAQNSTYTDYYDAETIELVAERYAKDIEIFDYSFGQ